MSDVYRHLEDFCINESTGELFLYEKVLLQYQTEKVVTRHFYESRDVEELFETVTRYGEKRYSNVSYFLSKERLGKWYVPILTLCAKVDYFNVGFYDRDFLCSVFRVSDRNLNKTLNKFVSISLMKYTGKGLTRQQIRIIWNPLNIWKGWEHSNTKITCIQDWYKSSYELVDESNTLCVDTTSTALPSGCISWDENLSVVSPDPYVSPYYNYSNKSRFRELMEISDADFELRLLSIPSKV